MVLVRRTEAWRRTRNGALAPFLLHGGANMKCWICGKEATKTMVPVHLGKGVIINRSPDKYSRCYCDECFDEVSERLKLENAEYVLLKKKQMFNTALEKLETQQIDMYKLRPAIDKVEQYIINNPDKFDSSYEILAAIALINSGIQFQMQKRILNYQVDIYIPSHKIIVEIDGERHQHSKKYDSERDQAILDEIGYEWQIIRIDTDHLDKNAMKLVTAVEQIINLRRTGKVNWRKVQR